MLEQHQHHLNCADQRRHTRGYAVGKDGLLAVVYDTSKAVHSVQFFGAAYGSGVCIRPGIMPAAGGQPPAVNTGVGGTSTAIMPGGRTTAVATKVGGKQGYYKTEESLAATVVVR